jgi:large subunit ribosomal protein L23
MALFDKLKGKKVNNKADEPNVLDMVKEESKDKAEKTPTVLKENTGRAHHILLRHHLSEKTNQLSAFGRYVFKVARTTNKIEVRKAIEAVYDVHVKDVNMINVSGKKRRQGKSVGRTQDWKKAVVTLKYGERISGLSEGV